MPSSSKSLPLGKKEKAEHVCGRQASSETSAKGIAQIADGYWALGSDLGHPAIAPGVYRRNEDRRCVPADRERNVRITRLGHSDSGVDVPRARC